MNAPGAVMCDRSVVGPASVAPDCGLRTVGDMDDRTAAPAVDLGSVLGVVAGSDGQPLTRTEKLVLLVWAASTSDGDEPVNVDALAHSCLATPAAVGAALRRLETKGLVSLLTSPAGLQVRPGAALLEPGATPTVEPPSAQALYDGLVGVGGILDGFRSDFPHDPVLAYHSALTAAEQLARDFAGISKDLPGYLRNAIIAAAASATHELDGRQVGRLCREAKVLGDRGGHHVVAALFATASADINGDTVAYVCRTARRYAGEDNR